MSKKSKEQAGAHAYAARLLTSVLNNLQEAKLELELECAGGALDPETAGLTAQAIMSIDFASRELVRAQNKVKTARDMAAAQGSANRD